MSTRIWFDTEFIEDGRTIEPLSIGLCKGETPETYSEYYAEPAETDRSKADPWVREHVLPYLKGPIKPRAQIAAEIREWAGPSPVFWAWYADYDWVVMCQLYGRMITLPPSWPMFCRDYRQETTPGELVRQDAYYDGPEHHALSDARWLRRAMLTKEAYRRGSVEVQMLSGEIRRLDG